MAIWVTKFPRGVSIILCYVMLSHYIGDIFMEQKMRFGLILVGNTV
jgi:hypothetical protein